MAGKRGAAQAFILENIDKILPGSPNKAMYEKRFKTMSDKQFDDFMKRLESGEEVLTLIAPNLDQKKISIDRNLKLAKQLGHEFFEHIWLTDPATGTTYKTPRKYLVMDLILRRQVQLLVKKMSVPDNNKHTDILTAQATGPSKGAKISFPEMQMLFAQGYEKSIVEFMKFRGGDTEAFNAMNRSMIDTGGFEQGSVAHLNSRVKSTETLSVIMKAMHLDNTL